MNLIGYLHHLLHHVLRHVVKIMYSKLVKLLVNQVQVKRLQMQIVHHQNLLQSERVQQHCNAVFLFLVFCPKRISMIIKSLIHGNMVILHRVQQLVDMVSQYKLVHLPVVQVLVD